MIIYPQREAGDDADVRDDDSLGAAAGDIKLGRMAYERRWMRGIMPRWAPWTSPEKLKRVRVAVAAAC